MIESINQYFEYQVITNVDLVNNLLISFPAIIFCITNKERFNLLNCDFDGNECSKKDFAEYLFATNTTESCYSYNMSPIKDSQSNFKSTQMFTADEGLELEIFLGKMVYENSELTVYIHGNTFYDFNNPIQIPNGTYFYFKAVIKPK